MAFSFPLAAAAALRDCAWLPSRPLAAALRPAAAGDASAATLLWGPCSGVEMDAAVSCRGRPLLRLTGVTTTPSAAVFAPSLIAREGDATTLEAAGIAAGAAAAAPLLASLCSSPLFRDGRDAALGGRPLLRCRDGCRGGGTITCASREASASLFNFPFGWFSSSPNIANNLVKRS